MLIGGLSACQSRERAHQLTPAFYHWKTTFDPTPADVSLLRQLDVQKIYLRFFDVDWNSNTRQAEPKAVTTFRGSGTGLTVVPVVYITNRTLLSLPASSVPILAQQLTAKIRRLAQQGGVSFREIQIDCDWSPGSRERYFALLRTLRERLGVPLSATIRLHQVKYAEQTGVPPVERGMLMCYNVADWKDPDTPNSILDLEVANRYLGFVDHYPLPLDAVLPLFGWTLVYRNSRFFKILNNLHRATLSRHSCLQRQADTNRFVARCDTLLFGFGVRRGDLFRAEACTVTDLTKVKDRLLTRIANRNLTFALYHLDSATIAPYPYETLRKLLQPAP